MRLSPGDLIQDNRDRECIVLWRDDQPTKEWLALQNDNRIKKLRTRLWWVAMPLGGGGIVVPEVLATFVRRATIDDALGIIATNKYSYFALVKVFPELKTMGVEPQ